MSAAVSFGILPRTRILNGPSGKWSGQNSFFGGIRVYRVPNIAGVWAQEYWEWRLRGLWGFISLVSPLIGAVLDYPFQSPLPFLLGMVAFAVAARSSAFTTELLARFTATQSPTRRG